MSDVEFVCSNCGQSLVIKDEYAGIKIQCPKCNVQLTVPGIFCCSKCEFTSQTDFGKCPKCNHFGKGPLGIKARKKKQFQRIGITIIIFVLACSGYISFSLFSKKLTEKKKIEIDRTLNVSQELVSKGEILKAYESLRRVKMTAERIRYQHDNIGRLLSEIEPKVNDIRKRQQLEKESRRSEEGEKKKEEEEERRLAEQKRKEEKEKERLHQTELQKMQQEYDSYLAEAQKVQEILERIGADLEVGINYSEFASRIRDMNYTWKKYDEFAIEKSKTGLLSHRMFERAKDMYILSLNAWKMEIEFHSDAGDYYSSDAYTYNTIIQYLDERKKRILQSTWLYAGFFTAKGVLAIRLKEDVPPDTCGLCKGNKTIECEYCFAAGKCSFCVLDGEFAGKECRICKRSGKCEMCKGTGKITCLLCLGKGIWP